MFVHVHIFYEVMLSTLHSDGCYKVVIRTLKEFIAIGWSTGQPNNVTPKCAIINGDIPLRLKPREHIHAHVDVSWTMGQCDICIPRNAKNYAELKQDTFVEYGVYTVLISLYFT